MEPDKIAAFKELISFLDDEECAKGTMRTAARETQDSGTIVTPQPGVHVATNFAFANTGFIAGEKGCVYIDCTEKMEKAKKVKEAYFKQDIKNKTIQGLVITHFHADHCMGTREMYSEFVKPEDTCETWNGPDIWSSEEFPQARHELEGHQLPFFFLRASRMYGFIYEKAKAMMNGETSGGFDNWEYGILQPNKFVKSDGQMYHMFDLGDMNLYGFHTAGETPDTMAVWIPERASLFIGDNIYPSFPNLTTLRGCRPRDPVKWMKALERYMTLKPELIVSGHGEPIIGASKCMDVLVNYRNGIKYVHDQTLRMMNEGKDSFEIMREISLPDTLKSHPYLQETYGKVGFSATGIFQHYAGGFSGNVLDMDPISSIQRLSILKTLVADKAETLGLPVDLTVAMLAGKHLQAANEGENELANAKFALETADAALMSDDADTVEVAQEFYSKACFMLGRWHKRGNNLNWSNYYVAKGLELKVGIVPKYTSGIRDAQAQRIPLVNLVSLLSVHLNPNVADLVSTEIKLQNSKLIKLNLHHGILDFEIKHGGVALDCGEISESKLRKMLCTLDLDGYKNVNLQKIFGFVDWSKTYKFD